MAEYIEREALIERLKFKRDAEMFPLKRYAGLESAIAQVKKAPVADVVEVRYGEWELEHETYGKMICSLCKEEALVNDFNEYVDSPFCPNCGAKMDWKGGAK